MKLPINTKRKGRKQNRQGAALMMSLFVILFVSVMLINVYETGMLQMTSHRNVIDYERALYLARAAVHHAAAELEADSDWRGTVTEGSFPANDTYQATAVDGEDGEVTVTGIGISGEVSQTHQVTIRPSK